MRNILNHLESGGNLRIANGGMGSFVSPDGGSGPSVLKVLQKLRSEGVVGDYIVSGDNTTYDSPNTLSYIFIHKP